MKSESAHSETSVANPVCACVCVRTKDSSVSTASAEGVLERNCMCVCVCVCAFVCIHFCLSMYVMAVHVFLASKCVIWIHLLL